MRRSGGDNEVELMTGYVGRGFRARAYAGFVVTRVDMKMGDETGGVKNQMLLKASHLLGYSEEEIHPACQHAQEGSVVRSLTAVQHHLRDPRSLLYRLE